MSLGYLEPDIAACRSPVTGSHKGDASLVSFRVNIAEHHDVGIIILEIVLFIQLECLCFKDIERSYCCNGQQKRFQKSIHIIIGQLVLLTNVSIIFKYKAARDYYVVVGEGMPEKIVPGSRRFHDYLGAAQVGLGLVPQDSARNHGYVLQVR